MINVWVTSGIKLWLWQDLSITLVAGTNPYTLGPAGNVVMTKPMRGIQGYWLDSSGTKTPLVMLSQQEYLLLTNVTQTGTLNSFYVDKQQATMNVYFYLVPDATAAAGTAHILIENQVTNFTNVTETMNFPVEWRIALRWGLADELCVGQPAAIMDRCQSRAMMYKMQLEDWNVEDADTRFACAAHQIHIDPIVACGIHLKPDVIGCNFCSIFNSEIASAR
jgi:hypothetical protein